MEKEKLLDINKCIWPYYDSHLLLKILDFYLKENVYEKTKVLEQKLKVLSLTKMDSELRNTYKELKRESDFPSCICF